MKPKDGRQQNNAELEKISDSPSDRGLHDTIEEAGRAAKETSNLIAVAAILMFASWLAYFATFSRNGIGGPEEWGQFGDFLGGILNPFLSFLALIALFRTLRIQSLQLNISSQELQQTRIEVTESRKAQQELASHSARTAAAQETAATLQLEVLQAQKRASRAAALTAEANLIQTHLDLLKATEIWNPNSSRVTDREMKKLQTNDLLNKLQATLEKLENMEGSA